MPFVLIPIRGAKEPIDSGRPYLKPSTKEKKRKKRKSQKARQPKGEKKPRAERRYAKRGAVKALCGTWFLVIWIPNITKILSKRNFKSKEGLLIKRLPSEALC